MGGTSREYLCGRLRKGGHFALLAAVERGELSAYAAAEEAGYITRKPILGAGSENAAKRRMFAVRNALRNVDAQQQQDEVLAPVEEPRREEPAVKTVVGGVGDLPCLYCSHPQAQLARREIADLRQWQPVSGSKRRAAAGLLPAQRGNDDRRRPHQLKRNGPAGKTGAEVMSYTRSYYRKEKGPQPADGGGPGGLTQLPYTDSRPPGRAPDVITDQPHR